MFINRDGHTRCVDCDEAYEVLDHAFNSDAPVGAPHVPPTDADVREWRAASRGAW
jgi:hypothetical protein